MKRFLNIGCSHSLKNPIFEFQEALQKAENILPKQPTAALNIPPTRLCQTAQGTSL